VKETFTWVESDLTLASANGETLEDDEEATAVLGVTGRAVGSVGALRVDVLTGAWVRDGTGAL
jgi:hypothetical protein